jgi:hypothetical protein
VYIMLIRVRGEGRQKRLRVNRAHNHAEGKLLVHLPSTLPVLYPPFVLAGRLDVRVSHAGFTCGLDAVAASECTI